MITQTTKLAQMLMDAKLTFKEIQVTDLTARGLSNKEIANQMFVTEKTVKFHLTNIYKKLGVASRAQLIVKCLPLMDFTEPFNG